LTQITIHECHRRTLTNDDIPLSGHLCQRIFHIDFIKAVLTVGFPTADVVTASCRQISREYPGCRAVAAAAALRFPTCALWAV